ncbi:hypothetical protein [Nonomuraea rubra]|uniref:hypothetical protein n=1 Tax=Nonomuraea rubra TaxID=46180 RepID=UPI0033D25453
MARRADRQPLFGIDAVRVESDGTIETSYAVTEEAMAHEPTAFVCSNDLAAIGVIFPPLTTATSPRAELGRRAWTLLQASINGEPLAEYTTLLKAPLQKRQSTGPAPTP